MRKNKIKKILLAVILAAMPMSVSAAVEISEIMYDLPSPGSDDSREWVEVWNNDTTAINLAEWKFFEANTNHGIVFSRGNETIAPGGFAVIADNPDKFLTDNPNFSGNLFDSSFSLSNTGERLALKNGDAIVDEVTYSSDWGAKDDGNSLQKISGQWKVGAPTPGVANVANSSSNNNPPASEQNSNSNQNQNTSSAASVEKPPEIKVEIAANRTVVSGADVLFAGKALDADGQPLDKVRFMWNFGDGETKEGQNVLHRFRFPGEYIVTLDAAYGKWGAAARLTTIAIKSPLIISRVEEGAAGFVELANEGVAELDLFGWYLKSNNVYFLIPKNTIVVGGKKIIFPNEVTKLVAGSVLLLYPNGVVAASYEKPVSVPPNETSNETLINKVDVDKKVPAKTAPPLKPIDSPRSDLVDYQIRSSNYEGAAVYEATPKNSGLGVWLLALSGLIVISLATFLFSKQKLASSADKPAPMDEYKIIE